jgi:general secretion pathway protein G
VCVVLNDAGAVTGKRGNMKKRSYTAFTFLEIIVVIGIVILLGYLLPKRTGLGDDELGPEKKARIQIRKIMKALECYKEDNGSYPSTEQGLQALVNEPSGDPKPKRWKQYLEKVPHDPWHHDFIYRCPGSGHRRAGNSDDEKMSGTYDTYDLISYGADDVKSDDDINSRDMSVGE